MSNNSLPPPIKYLNEPDCFLSHHKESVVHLEFIVGIACMLLFVFFTKTDHRWRVDSNILSLIFGASEFFTFSTLVAAVIFPTYIILLLAFGLLIVLNGFGFCMGYTKNKTSTKAIAHAIFAFISLILFPCRVIAGLNYQNPTNVDILKNLGNAISFFIGVIYSALDKKDLDLKFFNFAGGIVNFDITFTVFPKYVLFTITMLHDDKKHSVNISRARSGDYQQTEMMARNAMMKFLSYKQVILLHATNIMKQSRIDKYLYELNHDELDKNKYFTSLVTGFSIGIVKVAASYKRKSMLEYIKSLQQCFQSYETNLQLEMIVLNCQYVNRKFKNIAVIPQKTTMKMAIEIASLIYSTINNETVPENDNTAIYEMTAAFQRLEQLFILPSVIQMTIEVEEGSSLRKEYCEKLALHGRILSFINPYTVNDIAWDYKIAKTDAVASSHNTVITKHSKVIRLQDEITVSRFLTTASHVKSNGKQLIVAEDEHETTTSLTAILALTVKADRIRVTVSDTHDNLALQQLFEYEDL